MKKFSLLFSALFAYALSSSAGTKYLYQQNFEAAGSVAESGFTSPSAPEELSYGDTDGNYVWSNNPDYSEENEEAVTDPCTSGLLEVWTTNGDIRPLPHIEQPGKCQGVAPIWCLQIHFFDIFVISFAKIINNT